MTLKGKAGTILLRKQVKFKEALQTRWLIIKSSKVTGINYSTPKI